MRRLFEAVRAFLRRFYRPEPLTSVQLKALYRIKNSDIRRAQ